LLPSEDQNDENEMTDPSITDWISALSSIIATLIAGVAAYYAYKQYLQPPVQTPDPKAGQDKDAETEPTIVPVFRTAKQLTTLQLTSEGIECHLADKSSDKSELQWFLSKAQIATILTANDYSVSPGIKARSGTFSIGPRRNWLYSKSLFPEPDYLDGALGDLLKRAATPDP
jgi:hypothetical protein